jgi:pimeloyl-ACP methyl ester carboxylesterase
LRWQARRKTGLPPVFCVHGLTRRAEDFLDVGAALSATRDVYSLSMAGRGLSDRIDPAFYSYDQYIKDCLFVLAHEGIAQCDWLGTSMGGLIALLLAGGEHPTLIRRLVLNDIGPHVSSAALRDLATRVTPYNGMPFASREAAADYCRFSWGEFGIDDPAAWHKFVTLNLVEKKDGLYLHYDPAIVNALRHPDKIADMDLWGVYDKITCQMLVLHGEQSHVLTSDIIKAMTERGPRPRIVTFSGCGHAPALINPEQIGAIIGFLG